MRDLIDRQAAIDVIGEVHPLDHNAQAIKSRIERLPSAQPEIIRCKDCVKYKVYVDGYCPWIEQEVEEDFFCADGKRKEE